MTVVVLAEILFLLHEGESTGNDQWSFPVGMGETTDVINNALGFDSENKSAESEDLNLASVASLFSPDASLDPQNGLSTSTNKSIGLELVGIGIVGHRKTAIVRKSKQGAKNSALGKSSFSEREAIGDTGYRIVTIAQSHVIVTNGREEFALHVQRKASSTEDDDKNEDEPNQPAKTNTKTAEKSKEPQPIIAERHRELLNYRETKPGEDPRSILPSQEEIDYYKAHPEIARERFEKIIAALEAEKSQENEKGPEPIRTPFPAD